MAARLWLPSKALHCGLQDVRRNDDVERLKLFGIEMDVGEFIDTTRKKFGEAAEIYGGKVPHTLTSEERLTGDKIVAMCG